jgi:hypothetical protein
VRGDEPLKIQRAAGHDDLRTTQRYINEAQTFEGERFGQPFPSVPLATLSRFGQSFGLSAVDNARSPLFPRVDERPQRESKTLPTSASDVADRRENDADRATEGDTRQPRVSASRADADAAIRTAAKAAIDAGDLTRARALLELLDAKPRPAPLLTLATVRRTPTRGK